MLLLLLLKGVLLLLQGVMVCCCSGLALVAVSHFMCFLNLEPQDNNWGGGDSQQKARSLEAELVEMFRTKKQVYRDEVEDYLNAYLDDHFGTYAEDNRQVSCRQ